MPDSTRFAVLTQLKVGAAAPIRSVNLAREQDASVDVAVASGRNASVGDGAHCPDRGLYEDKLTLDRLRGAIALGAAALDRGTFDTMPPGEVPAWLGRPDSDRDREPPIQPVRIPKRFAATALPRLARQTPFAIWR